LNWKMCNYLNSKKSAL